MQYAIFSDIHSNAQALSEVLRDASQRDIEAYLCLGDVGTDPSQRMVRSVGAETVFGNWEVSGWRHLSPEYQIGVGSVGQPKYSTSPSYVIFDTESRQVEFIRVW